MDFFDEYAHDIPGIIYFPTSLLTKEIENSYEDILQGCSCESVCSKYKKCICIMKSGTYYTFDDINDLSTYSIQEDMKKNPTYECNEFCKCKGYMCGNKLVQFGPHKDLKVKLCDNDKKGLGLYTTRKLKKGSFVCEYAGEIITEEEAMKRFKIYNDQNKPNYIFCVKEHFGISIMKTFIDPTYYGNIGRYVNHSCQPNCTLFILRIKNDMPVVGIFANDHIEENIEITYDYGEESQDSEKSARKACYCGSDCCRRYLPFDSTV